MQAKKLPFFKNETDYLDNSTVSTGFDILDRPTGAIAVGSLNIVADTRRSTASYTQILLTNMVRLSFEEKKKPAVYMSLNLSSEIDLMGQFVRQGLNHANEIAFTDEQEFIDDLTIGIC